MASKREMRDAFTFSSLELSRLWRNADVLGGARCLNATGQRKMQGTLLCSCRAQVCRIIRNESESVNSWKLR